MNRWITTDEAAILCTCIVESVEYHKYISNDQIRQTGLQYSPGLSDWVGEIGVRLIRDWSEAEAVALESSHLDLAFGHQHRHTQVIAAAPSRD